MKSVSFVGQTGKKEMFKVNKNEIGLMLEMGVVTVKFKKLDGTDRIMRCTLNPKFLPEMDEEADVNPRKKSDSSVAVWDIDLQGWRAFRYDSVEYAVLSEQV